MDTTALRRCVGMVRQHALAFTMALAFALPGCTQDLGPRPDYDPGVTAADFVAGIDNPWLPLVPGARWTYEFDEDGEQGVIEVRVLDETREVMGVQATVVRDTETVGGELAEDTWDWFAQDRAGNVWYLGEDTCEYEDGACVDTGGAWEWGKDGALPGVVMWADPAAHMEPYFQEFYWGEAVDEAQYVDAGRHIEVGAGAFDDTITTREWNRLEPGHAELAHYARGVGVILKEPADGQEGSGERLIAYSVPSA
jgi:hypothetical protein